MTQDDIGISDSHMQFTPMEVWHVTPALRWSHFDGKLQQCWHSSNGRFEWRDVPVLGTPEYEQTGLPE